MRTMLCFLSVYLARIHGSAKLRKSQTEQRLHSKQQCRSAATCIMGTPQRSIRRVWKFFIYELAGGRVVSIVHTHSPCTSNTQGGLHRKLACEQGVRSLLWSTDLGGAPTRLLGLRRVSAVPVRAVRADAVVWCTVCRDMAVAASDRGRREM